MRASNPKRSALTALLLGCAMLFAAGPLVGTADAGPKHKKKNQGAGHYHQGASGVAYCDVVHAPPRYRPRYRRAYRPVYRPAPYCSVARPWYVGAPRLVVAGSPYYFHAGLGVYFGGVALTVELGNYAPEGYAYVDPACGELFYSVEGYAIHSQRARHAPVLYAEQMDTGRHGGHGRHGGR